MLAPIFYDSSEVVLNPDDLIISKTDLKGRITYANRTFMRIAGLDEEHLLNQPHNIIRHPDMPRGVFKFIWQELRQGHEFFGFVKNTTADGGFYWVFANITPDLDIEGNIQGYFSVRRRPSRSAVEAIEPVYRKMLEIEQRHGKPEGPDHSLAFLQQLLKGQQMSYERYIMQLQSH